MKKQVVISKKLFIFLLAGCLFSVFSFLNFALYVAAKEAEDPDSYKELKVFTDVIALVQKNYVESVNIKQLIEGALKGMLLNLDPHSSYMTEESYNDLKVETKGEFGGLGIEITVKDGLLTVVTPIEDSPAYTAGVQPGDQIIKIEDEFTKNMTMVDAVKKMRGPKGSHVNISVHRKDRRDLIPYQIVRDVIKVKSVRFRLMEDRFGYIRLAQFQEESTDEFMKALEELNKQAKDKQLQGLVVDLRNNPGGLLNQATRISDIFLKEGVIVYTDGRLDSQKQKFYAHDDGKEPAFPIIMLVNGGSASASEIVAGAMQDAHRAVILGTQSFGKGSVQTILPMENGGGLRLTTALYYTRSGRSIQAQGVTPDVIVAEKRAANGAAVSEDGDEDLGWPMKEKDLPGAIKNPQNNNTEKPNEKKQGAVNKEDQSKDTSKDKENEDRIPVGSRKTITEDLNKVLKEDPQLDEAIKLLKTWHVFQGKPGIQAQGDAANQG